MEPDHTSSHSVAAKLNRSVWRSFTYLSDRSSPAQDSDAAQSLDSQQSEPTPAQRHFGQSLFGREEQELQQAIQTYSQLPLLPLALAKVGDRVRIMALNCGESNSRLMGMGFMPNVVLKIISSTPTGSVIVALQDQRLGLGAEMAQQILVMPADIPCDRTLNQAHTTYQPHTRSTPTMTSISHAIPPALAPETSLKLRDTAIGSRLKVRGYEPTARDYKRKLLAMGLTPGTELLVKRHAPLGDPTEIEVRGFRLSLRKDEADALMVELLS